MRNLKDWLTGYLTYVENTESAAIYHTWVGISLIAACLRRKVFFEFGRIKIHPNLFVVLVSEPGISRKTQAISFGEDILKEIPGIQISADCTTPQAMLEDLELAADDAVMPDSTMYRHSSLTILSGEFESFLGQKKENSKMIVTLTDLFDCKNRPFKYRTKHSGSNIVPHVYLNLMAATTPESLASVLPATAIGGGLTSRIIFVWAGGKEKKVDVPETNPELEELKQLIIQDLAVISRIAGGYTFDTTSRQWWKDFYNNYEERDPNRICQDPAFSGWYSRKPTMMIKIATCLAASRHSNLIVSTEDFERGLRILEDAERTMGKTFVAVGKSDVAAEVDLVKGVVQRYKYLSEKKLFQIVWRDVDAKKFDNVMSTLTRRGAVQRMFQGPNGEKEVWYRYVRE
ncbi:MAG: DUF3987 domain-containing protein [Anaerovoracaceae bacterium]